jgi:hypothetical protein
MKLSSLLNPVRDNRRLRASGVQKIPCEYGRVCIGHTSGSVDIMLKEHQRHIRLEHLDKSALARDTTFQPTMPPSMP